MENDAARGRESAVALLSGGLDSAVAGFAVLCDASGTTGMTEPVFITRIRVWLNHRDHAMAAKRVVNHVQIAWFEDIQG